MAVSWTAKFFVFVVAAAETRRRTHGDKNDGKNQGQQGNLLLDRPREERSTRRFDLLGELRIRHGRNRAQK